MNNLSVHKPTKLVSKYPMANPAEVKEPYQPTSLDFLMIYILKSMIIPESDFHEPVENEL